MLVTGELFEIAWRALVARESAAGYERRHGNGHLRVDLEEDRKIRGTAIVFNTRSVDLGGFYEIIRSDAVDRTLNSGKEVLGLWNHDTGLPFALSPVNMNLKKSREGLRVMIDPLASFPQERLDLIASGIVKGMSFRFRVIEDKWHTEEGFPVREVLDMEFDEVSVVAYPAYPTTDVSVALRSLREYRKAPSIEWRRKQIRTALAR